MPALTYLKIARAQGAPIPWGFRFSRLDRRRPIGKSIQAIARQRGGGTASNDRKRLLMSDRAPSGEERPSQAELAEFVAAAETGTRNPIGPAGTLLAGVALAWSLFQLWIASPLPFLVANIIPVLNDNQTRSIHLAFAIFLAYTGRPALKRSPQDRVPLHDWVLALVGAFCAAYLYLFYRELSERPGLPTTTDLVVSGAGIVLLLEATRRALGPPLMIVAMVFLFYIFFGDRSFVPEVIQWKGASFAKAMSHQWLSTEGVFGIAIGVSTSMVFLFVLFGALLERPVPATISSGSPSPCWATYAAGPPRPRLSPRA